MRIAFISPSPAVLKHDWYRDLPYQKVGVPNLAKCLAKVLRERFPGAVIALGGLQNMSTAAPRPGKRR